MNYLRASCRMKSATTRILAWLLSAALTLPLVLYGVLFFTDVDSFRGQLERHVSAALNRTIQFDGPIILEPSLTPRLVIEGLSIANAVVVTGTLSAPEVETTVLPRRRLAGFGGGIL